MTTSYTELDWAAIDSIVNQSVVNMSWVVEALRTPNFNVDCLSKCQLVSKHKIVSLLQDWKADVDDVAICGGWYGQLAHMLHNAQIGARYSNVDLDPSLKQAAEYLNRRIKYTHHTGDMYAHDYSGYSLIINTSSEHIPSLSTWLQCIPKGTLVALQSNNYDSINEHINCSSDIEEFCEKATLSEYYVADSTVMPMYTRFSIIGRK